MREIGHRWRLPAYLDGARLRLRAQSGFALIEVLVSAALLLVIAGGVLAGIEGPSRTAAQNETRSQASDLAQQDQDRMRSMTFSSLVGYTQTTPVTVGHVTYQRYSSAIWIHDDNDPDSCQTQNNNNQGDYLKITSRVTPPNGSPVELDSLMAAPPGQYTNKGTLAVLLTNHLNQPVVGQSVTITGPDNMTVPTNSIGCAVFGLVTKGNYMVTFSRAGWLDPDGVNAVSLPTSVTASSTTIVPHQYAPSGRINVSVDTKVGAAAPVASPAKAVMISNSGITTGSLTFNAPATPTQGSTSFALDVFPFQSGYNVWAGSCAANDPTKYGAAPVTATPPASGSVNVTVRQPAINLHLTRNGTNYATTTNGKVRVYNTDAGCGSTFTSETLSTGLFAAAGNPGPGFPYGHYTVCGDDNTHYDNGTVANTVAAGTATLALDIPTGKKAPQAGVCT
jgi:Tfp pilus assembly protein PilV